MIPGIGALQFGPAGIGAAAALAVGLWMLGRRARRGGLEESDVVSLYSFMAAAAAGAASAGLLLGSGISGQAVLLTGVLAGLLYCRSRNYGVSRSLWLLDAGAFCAPFIAAVARLGCVLAHDHPGRLSGSFLAVRFPAGRAYDLALIEFLFLEAMCVAFVILDRTPRPPGFFLAAATIAYSAFRIFRGGFEAQPHVMRWAVLATAALVVLIARELLSDSASQTSEIRLH